MDVIKYQVCSSEVAFTVSVFCSLVQTVAMFARILPASSVSLTWPEGREIYIYKKKTSKSPTYKCRTQVRVCIRPKSGWIR